MTIDSTKPIEDDTLLVRFSQLSRKGRTLDPSDLMDSPWWLTKDMFDWLMGRARSSSRGVVEIIREQMLLPPEWNGANCFVQAFPKPGVRLGAWFGRPRAVQEGKNGPARTWQVATEASMTWMYQLYIPGLNGKMPLNSLKWLEFEGVYGLKPTPDRRGQPRYPCIRSGKVHGG